ncbi:MAG TPA: hypothetical protein EYG79_02630 [Rhodobacteraceae bacterium]|nr:hypothetical protein [Paracoccaceae bacterium]
MFRVQYCEVSDGLWALRCVEENWDGSLGYAHRENVDGVNGVFLPEKQFPAMHGLFGLDGSCKMDSEGEFKSALITKREFEAVWEQAAKEDERM